MTFFQFWDHVYTSQSKDDSYGQWKWSMRWFLRSMCLGMGILKPDFATRNWVQVVYLFIWSQEHSEGNREVTGRGGKPINNVLMSWLLLWEPGAGFYWDCVEHTSEMSQWGEMKQGYVCHHPASFLGPRPICTSSLPCAGDPAHTHGQRLSLGRHRTPSECRKPSAGGLLKDQSMSLCLSHVIYFVKGL